MTTEEFRARVAEAFDGMAEDTLTDGYAFDYTSGVEAEFPDVESFEEWVMLGADYLRPSDGIRYTDEELKLIREAAQAEYNRLVAIWPGEREQE